MSDLNSDLLGRSINYHGHCLFKKLAKDNIKTIKAVDMGAIDYKVYQARIPEIK